MNAHTPGRCPECGAPAEHGHIVGWVYDENGAKVNADLLAALERFVELDAGRLEYGPRFHDDARAAIAKAKGEG